MPRKLAYTHTHTHANRDKTNTKAPWHKVDMVRNNWNQCIEIPVGDICFVCGCGCETHPKLSPEEVLRKILEEQGFQGVWEAHLVGIRVVRKVNELRKAMVHQDQVLGFRVIRVLLMVTVDNFRDHFGVMPLEEGLKISAEDAQLRVQLALAVTILGPERKNVTGVIIDKYSIPRSAMIYDEESNAFPLRPFKVELFSAQCSLFMLCFDVLLVLTNAPRLRSRESSIVCSPWSCFIIGSGVVAEQSNNSILKECLNECEVTCNLFEVD